jgi:hypothetical protein
MLANRGDPSQLSAAYLCVVLLRQCQGRGHRLHVHRLTQAALTHLAQARQLVHVGRCQQVLRHVDPKVAALKLLRQRVWGVEETRTHTQVAHRHQQR